MSERTLVSIIAKGYYKNLIDTQDTMSHHTMHRQSLLQGVVSHNMFVGLRVRNPRLAYI